MQYNRLGRAGLKVSELSFGSWVTFHNQMQIKDVMNTMAIAFDHGVNFFDNAEVYAGGKSEELMGQALKKLNWPRMKYVIATKFYWGISDGPNEKNTLNRKYLMHAMEGSLRRLDLDYVDVIYCHRPDSQTPIEETVWAMSDLIAKGQALYWGTSEWSADEIRQAMLICEKYGLRKPVVEQPQYNLFRRQRVEKEYARLYEDYGIGLTTWSPLASGQLTGKYLESVPNNSRAQMESMNSLRDDIQDDKKRAAIKSFVGLAKEMGMQSGQLALLWCLSNKNVSSVILGASQDSQLLDNLKTLEFKSKFNFEIKDKISGMFAGFEKL